MVSENKNREGFNILVLFSLGALVLFTLTNRQYGFHRDELAFLDEGRHLAWGFVEYPPLTPFIAHIAYKLFGPSLVGLRSFAALSVSLIILLSGLIAGELGGSRWAQGITAWAVAIAPMALTNASLFTYMTFDYLWCVLIAYLIIRLIKSENPRWWLGIGGVIGLGMMTKYNMAFFVGGIVAGVVFTPMRRYLKSPWLWGGVVLALLIFLPNLIWQIHHHFISLQFLSSIRARAIQLGRTKTYLLDQFYICTNIATIVLWINGFRFYWVNHEGRQYRILGWVYLVPFVLYFIVKGKGYYLSPAYPMLLAAGTCLAEKRLDSLKGARLRKRLVSLYSGLIIGGIVAMGLSLPLAPINSVWWNLVNKVNPELREEIGWPELVHTVADIRDTLPLEERTHVGILAGNYGEAGAINLYGPSYGLPQAISGVNSFWLRGYGNPPPQTLIVIGLSREDTEKIFENCTLAGHSSNRYGVQNEETKEHPDIFICRKLRKPWQEFWKSFRYFG